MLGLMTARLLLCPSPLYGSNLVVPPEVLQQEASPVVLLRATTGTDPPTSMLFQRSCTGLHSR